MFCDLVGSTALSTRLDPEDLREVIAAYHQCTADVVTRLGGYVAKYMGDGVLIYFGYPEAHEADAENAVRAALALIEAVTRLFAEGGHQIRIGIATGLVVVGELVGSGEAQERNVVGETPNLAARLQSAAAPNTAVIDATTRRLAGDLFAYEAIAPAALKGFAEPVGAWSILRERSIASRFEALRTASLAPLIGREEEIELLLRRWQQIEDGEGRVVLLAGEAGHRQVAPDRGAGGARDGRGADVPALFLPAAYQGSALAADPGANPACRGFQAGRYAGRKARQASGSARRRDRAPRPSFRRIVGIGRQPAGRRPIPDPQSEAAAASSPRWSADSKRCRAAARC